MAKAGDKVVDAQGQEWRFTEGGQWRLYKNGKKTDTLSKTQPGAGAAPGAKPGATDAGASQPTTVNNTTPSNLSPEGSQWLNLAWQNLQQQVAQNLITPEQAQKQGENNNALIASETPAQQAQRLKLQGDVQNNLINYSDLENQMYQSKQAANQTSPATGTNLTPTSTTSQVTNEIADVAKGSTIAGNLLTNPDQVNPFGSSNITIDPNTGKPTVTQTLSQPNQQVLSGIQNTSMGASQFMGNMFGGGSGGQQQGGGYQQQVMPSNGQVKEGAGGTASGASYGQHTGQAGGPQPGDERVYQQGGQQQGGGTPGLNDFVVGAGPQSGYSDPAMEKAIYARLTQGMDDKYRREEDQLSQTLANRGIGPGSGEAYTNAMKDFRTARDTNFENARNNATIQGTQTAVQRQQNNIGGLGTMFGGAGTMANIAQGGFYQPNFQGFNSVNYQQPDVQGLYNTQYAGQLTREQIASQEKQQQMQIEAQKALAKGIGGGGGEESSGSNNAFATRPPGS